MRSHPKPYPTKPFLLSSTQAKQQAKDMLFKGKRNDEPNVCVAGEKRTVLTLASCGTDLERALGSLHVQILGLNDLVLLSTLVIYCPETQTGRAESA